MRAALGFVVGALTAVLVVAGGTYLVLNLGCVTFLKHSNKLPPEVRVAWQAAARQSQGRMGEEEKSSAVARTSVVTPAGSGKRSGR
jgi:hypothetical protein